jgi:ferredoxin
MAMIRMTWVGSHWARTKKYFDVPAKKGDEGALFGIFIDPTKCKGCAECVQVCDDLDYHALKMVAKDETTLPRYRAAFNLFRQIGPTPEEYINQKALADFMLAEHAALLYVGGAGSCMGCGEATAIRMMLAATGFVHGPENIGIVAATGCNTVYGSTYPYNPYIVPWTNSLFENAPADAMGIRARWNQRGWDYTLELWRRRRDVRHRFQNRRMLASGMDVKVLVLDTRFIPIPAGKPRPLRILARMPRWRPMVIRRKESASGARNWRKSAWLIPRSTWRRPLPRTSTIFTKRCSKPTSIPDRR